MRLILVRHGQTPSNVLGLLDTAPPGPGLTDLGVAQAEQVPVALRGETIVAVFASTARRAQETAAPLAGQRGLPVEIRDGLREIAAGDWEMAGDETSVHGYLATIGRWMTGELDLRVPGPAGESGREVLQRFDIVIDEVAAPTLGAAQAAVVVAHGAVIRLWASVRSGNLRPGFGAHHRLANTGIVILDGTVAAGWQCRSWTDVDPGPAWSAPASVPGPAPDAGAAADPDPGDGPAGDDIPVEVAARRD